MQIASYCDSKKPDCDQTEHVKRLGRQGIYVEPSSGSSKRLRDENGTYDKEKKEAKKELEKTAHEKAAHDALETAQHGAVDLAKTVGIITVKAVKNLKEMDLNEANWPTFAQAITKEIEEVQEPKKSQIIEAIKAIPALLAAYAACDAAAE